MCEKKKEDLSRERGGGGFAQKLRFFVSSFLLKSDLTPAHADNWSPSPTPNSSSLEFVPMQWNHVGIDDLGKKAEEVKAGAVVGFNEPELPVRITYVRERSELMKNYRL